MATQHAFGWQFIDRKDASTSATIVFTIPTGFEAIEFFIAGATTDSDDDTLTFRLSDDAGVGYEAEAADYSWTVDLGDSVTASNTAAADVGGTDDEVQLNEIYGLGATAGESLSCRLTFWNHDSTTLRTQGVFQTVTCMPDTLIARANGAFQFLALDNTEAIQFLMLAGNIVAGSFSMFGLKVPSA